MANEASNTQGSSEEAPMRRKPPVDRKKLEKTRKELEVKARAESSSTVQYPEDGEAAVNPMETARARAEASLRDSVVEDLPESGTVVETGIETTVETGPVIDVETGPGTKIEPKKGEPEVVVKSDERLKDTTPVLELAPEPEKIVKAPEGTPNFLEAAYDTANQQAQEKKDSEKKSGGDSIPNPDREILDSLVVDLSQLDIQEANLIQRNKFAQTALETDATYQVIALRSAYSAGMKGLTFKDKDVLRNSSADPLNERKRFYSTVHDKIGPCSVGEMTFTEFLKVTAFDDLDTLLFGIFCQTYPGDTEFTVTCGKCHRPVQVKVKPASFIKVHDDAIFAWIDEVIKSQIKPMELLGRSLVHRTKRIILPKSKVVIDVRTASLQDHLNMLGFYTSASNIKGQRETFGSMIYIKDVFLPNIEAIRRTGKPVFAPLEDWAEKFRVVCDLPSEDADELNRCINEKESEYSVSHRLKAMPCPSCKEDIGDINIDIERLLVFRMEQTSTPSTSDNQTT